MQKFWQIKNEANMDSAELLLYGQICDSVPWWDIENNIITAKQFAQDIAALGGKRLCVRINSAGGDVFAAHAIYNQLVTYPGEVIVRVDGLAASAATIICMAASSIIMPANAVMMIHNPMLLLYGSYDVQSMEKMITQLGTIKDSIIAAYKKKCKVSEEVLAELMNAETWMSAQEALSYGFADVVEQPVTVQMSANALVINNVKHDIENIANAEQLKNIFNKGEKKSSMNFIQEVKDLVAKYTSRAQNTGDAKPALPAINQTEIIAAERSRVQALDALNDGSQTVGAIINDAKQNGKTAAEIEGVVNIIKQNTPKAMEEATAIEYIANLIADNQESGANGIKGQGQISRSDNEKMEQEAVTSSMSAFINKKFGRVQ